MHVICSFLAEFFSIRQLTTRVSYFLFASIFYLNVAVRTRYCCYYCTVTVLSMMIMMMMLVLMLIAIEPFVQCVQYESSDEALNYINEMLSSMRQHMSVFDLGSILIKPVQRILKYPLLLNELIKVCHSFV